MMMMMLMMMVGSMKIAVMTMLTDPIRSLQLLAALLILFLLLLAMLYVNRNCSLLRTLKLFSFFFSFFLHEDFGSLFLVQWRHPRFPLNGIKKYLTCNNNKVVVNDE